MLLGPGQGEGVVDRGLCVAPFDLVLPLLQHGGLHGMRERGTDFSIVWRERRALANVGTSCLGHSQRKTNSLFALIKVVLLGCVIDSE